MKRRVAAGLAAFALATSFGATANANGRFPESNKVVVTPGDPDTLYLRVTFGLLVSHDHGHTWDWICEGSVGFTGNEDPMYAATPNGTVLATTLLGVTVSHDRGCSFGFAGGELAGKLFVDLAQRPDDPKSVVLFSSAFQGKSDAGTAAFDTRLWETKDEASTFAALGPPVDPDFFPLTVDVTGLDPARVYMSGVRDPGGTPKGTFLVSRDHGQTFESIEVPLQLTEDSLYIAGVSPTNPDRVFLRTSAKNGLSTRLLVTDDAGKTFRTAYQAQGPLMGFAISPDASRVWVGGPKDGLLIANGSDLAFASKAGLNVQCLTATADGLWACSDESSGFVAGFSSDDGATFEPRLHFCGIRGPLACAEGTSTNLQCTLGQRGQPPKPPWPDQYRNLGCGTLDAGTPTVRPLPYAVDDQGCLCGTSSSTATSEGATTPALLALASGLGIALVRRRARRR